VGVITAFRKSCLRLAKPAGIQNLLGSVVSISNHMRVVLWGFREHTCQAGP